MGPQTGNNGDKEENPWIPYYEKGGEGMLQSSHVNKYDYDIQSDHSE